MSLAEQIQQHDTATIVALVLFLFGLALFAAFAAYRYLQRARLIEDTPTQKTRSAAQGYAELAGRVQPLMEAVLRAPLSGLPCLWYRYRVEQRVTDSRNRSSWRTIEQGVSDQWFKLTDETGSIAIDPRGADVDTPACYRWEGDYRASVSTLPGALLAFMNQRNFGGRYRLTEQRVHAGERLFALGMLKNAQSHDRGAGLSGAARTLLHTWKQDQDNLKQQFDRNRDGRIDADEWALAQQAAETAALQQAPTLALNVLGACNNGRPFILSAYPQTQLVQRFKLYAAAGSVAAFAIGAAAMWILNIRFH